MRKGRWIDGQMHKMSNSKEVEAKRRQLIPELCDDCDDLSSSVNSQQIIKNETLLHSAVEGHVECVKACLKTGADVNCGQKTAPFYTVLMSAAYDEQIECLNVLIAAGADVNQEGAYGFTALTLAAYRGQDGCLNALIKAGADVNKGTSRTPLIHAIQGGHDKCVKALIAAGADVCVQDNAALMFATEKRNVEYVKLLVKAGADVNKEKSDGYTALMLAVLNCDVDCAQALIESGADVNKQNIHGGTALMIAAQKFRDKCVDMLIRAGADVNLQDKIGRTALINATYKRNVIALYRTLPGALFQQERCGNTALIRPEREGYEKCVTALLRAGADVNVLNEQGLNALSLILSRETTHREESEQDVSTLLLFAAGETIDETVVTVPDYLKHGDLKLDLKHLCRETIRKHLLQLNPVNLFHRVPQLGLPSSLEKYLLYNVSIGEPITVTVKPTRQIIN